MSGLPGIGRRQLMASASVGVVTAASVESGMGGGSVGKLADPQAAATWCAIWFVIALIFLFFLIP